MGPVEITWTKPWGPATSSEQTRGDTVNCIYVSFLTQNLLGVKYYLTYLCA